MSDEDTPPAAGGLRRFSDAAFWSLSLLIVFLAYLLVMKAAGSTSWLQAALASVVNLLSLLIVAAPLRLLLLRFVLRRSAPLQLGLHLALAPAFSLLWYWTMMVLIGLAGGASATRFEVRPFFVDTATAWQLLQGVTVYALIAVVALLRASPPVPSFMVAPPSTGVADGEPSFARYFIRRGDEIFPVDVSQIISIAGADDYAEVATTAGRHLVRMTLSDFERALEGGSFIRVHRSHIVNVDRIVRAEPAGGGRLLLHMEDGEIVQASRSGARLLRDRVL